MLTNSDSIFVSELMIPNKASGLIFLGNETLPDIGHTCSLNDRF